MAASVIQANGTEELEDGLRTGQIDQRSAKRLQTKWTRFHTIDYEFSDNLNPWGPIIVKF